MRKFSKKFISIFLIVFLSFSLFSKTSLAFTNAIGFGSATSGLVSILPDSGSQMLSNIFKQYNTSQKMVAEMSQKMNIAQKKTDAPQVSITFSPSNPNPGEKVTATATPSGFKNDMDKMYFTWYLRHAGEKESDKNLSPTKRIEKYKERAMRMIASDDFEGSDADDTDGDGYRAVFGGDDQRNIGEESHCFFRDTEKGVDYEFPECKHLFPEAPYKKTGDNEFGKDEEAFWKTDPADSDTADRGQVDEATVAGLGVMSFTWTYQEGDEVGVAVEGASTNFTDYDDASYKVMWALVDNKCELTEDALADPGGGLGSGGFCPASCGSVTLDGHTFTPTAYGEYCALSTEHGLGADPYLETHCGEVMAAFDAKSGCTGFEERCTDEDHTLVLVMNGTHGDNTSDTAATVDPAEWPDCPDGCDFTRTVTKNSIRQEQAPSSSYSIDVSSEKKTIQTIHLNSRRGSTFTYSFGEDSGEGAIGPGETTEMDPPTNEECYAIDGISSESGITDQSCCPDGKECSVISSTTVTNSDSGYSINVGQSEGAGNLFKMTVDDLNKCLLQNFTSPTEGGKSKKINVSLSYTPTNPINDPSGANSDEINIDSTIDNPNDAEFLYYKWEAFLGTSADEEGEWVPLSKNYLDGAGETMGLGIKNLKFNLKFPSDAGYLKIKLTVSENAYNGERQGHSSVIIPITSNSSKINIYAANVSDALTFSKGTQKCLKNNQDEPICQVAKNQILAVEASDTNLTAFLWKADGENFSYKYDGSGKATNPAYFPVTKNVGETFNVSLSAINKETGEKLNLTRAFKVVDPEITISSSDMSSSVPVLQGYYTDYDDVSWPDYSTTEMETLNGSTIQLKADFTAATPPDENIEWYVDGALLGTGPTISFPASKTSGNYNVMVNALYSQDNATGKALLQYWGINYDGLYEKDLSASMNINTVGSISDTTASGKAKKYMASLVAGFPSYLNFLFRIILTTGLLLFTIKVIFYLLFAEKKKKVSF